MNAFVAVMESSASALTAANTWTTPFDPLVFTEPLLFGPMVPACYRLDGPGAQHCAAAAFREQLAAIPRASVEHDVAAQPGVGYGGPAFDDPTRNSTE